MDATSIVFHHWDDVVFENRNKDYGAYLLRRAYAHRLLSGVGVTLTGIALVLSLHNIYSGEEIRGEVLPPLTRTDVILTHPPSIERKERPQNIIHPPRTNARNRSIVVTRDQVVDANQVEEIREFIEADGVTSGEVGTLDGTGTLAVIDPQPVIEPIRDFAEVMPQYEGGLEAMMKFIQKKIRYPRAPRTLGIDGTVYVRFVVNGDGSISGVEIIKGVHPDYDREAIRVISMLPAWKGGSHNGRPVRVRMVLPIKFNLKQ